MVDMGFRTVAYISDCAMRVFSCPSIFHGLSTDFHKWNTFSMFITFSSYKVAEIFRAQQKTIKVVNLIILLLDRVHIY